MKSILKLLVLVCIAGSFAGGTAGAAGKLDTKVLKPGDGAEAELHSKVTVHYTGWLMDGTKFDSSVDRRQPFKFTLGAGQVIRGWEMGVVGMRVGEKRELIIPSELGYGVRGAAGGLIPPNATLRFEVELIAVEKQAYTNIDNDELKALMARGGKVLDLRRPDEWKATGVIKGAIKLTAFDANQQFIRSFPEELEKLVKRDEEIALICRVGNRSSTIARAMVSQAGYTKIFNVTKGIQSWIKAGGEVVK